jgi:hypothetical protein
MKLIKLTSLKGKEPIYINIEHIGHIYEVDETKSYGSVDTPAHTVIGVTTHNNGGFKVTESYVDIVKKIESKAYNGGTTI